MSRRRSERTRAVPTGKVSSSWNLAGTPIPRLSRGKLRARPLLESHLRVRPTAWRVLGGSSGSFGRRVRHGGRTPFSVEQSDRSWIDCEAFDQRDRRPRGMRNKLQMQVQRAMIGKETYTEWDDLGRVELPPDATAKAGAVILMA